MKFCKCGCGKEIPFRKSHKATGVPQYIWGHQWKGKKHSEETKNKLRNKIVSKETKLKMSLTKKGLGENHSSKRLEVRQKISLGNLKNPHRYWAGKRRSVEDRLKMSNGRKQYFLNGGSHWSRGKTKETDPRLLLVSEKIKQQIAKQPLTLKGRFFDTKPELKMKEILNELQIPYDFQKYISGVGLVDFYIPEQNLIIFVDGCYWHNCPIHFPDKRKEARIKDLTANEKCLNAGYEILRIWDHDIKSSLQTIKKKLEVLCFL